MGDALDLAVVVTTFNSMRTIERCLRSVKGLAKDIYVVDSGSTDGTIEFCKEQGAHVVHQAWQGFAKQKAFALSLATTQAWILVLDSDESLEADLQSGLRDAITRATPQTRAIEINRKMWYVGGWINHVGFPDWVVRCGRRGALRMIDRPVHECFQADGLTVRAQGICRHDSWDGFCDALDRGAKYAKLSASQRRSSKFPVISATCSILAIIFKQGIMRRGFLDGWRGAAAIAAYCIGRFASTMAAYERNR